MARPKPAMRARAASDRSATVTWKSGAKSRAMAPPTRPAPSTTTCVMKDSLGLSHAGFHREVDRPAEGHQNEPRPGITGSVDEEGAHDGAGPRHVEQGHHRVAPDPHGAGQVRPPQAQEDDAAHREDVEEDGGQHHEVQQLPISTGEGQGAGPEGLDPEAESRDAVLVEAGSQGMEEAIHRHALVDPGPGEEQSVQAAEGGDEDDAGHDEPAPRAEEGLQGRAGHPVLGSSGDARGAQHPQVGQVRHDVQAADQRGADEQGEGDGPAGFLHLTGDEGDGVPGVRGEHAARLHHQQRREEGQGHIAELVRIGARHGRDGGVEPEPQADEGRQAADLGHGEEVLDAGAQSHAVEVHHREQGDDRDGREARGREAQVVGAHADRLADPQQRNLQVGAQPGGIRHPGDEVTQILAEGHGHGRQGAALDDREEGPAIEEAHGRAVDLTQVGILAPSLGEEARQLPVAESREERQHGRETPGRQEEAAGAVGPHHVRSHDEYATADHGAGNEHGGREESYVAAIAGCVHGILQRSRRNHATTAFWRHGTILDLPPALPGHTDAGRPAVPGGMVGLDGAGPPPAGGDGAGEEGDEHQPDRGSAGAPGRHPLGFPVPALGPFPQAATHPRRIRLRGPGQPGRCGRQAAAGGHPLHHCLHS